MNPGDRISITRDNECVIAPPPGFTPDIGRLVHMLEVVRQATLRTVRNLTIQELDTQVLPGGNTIGMLLAHIAGIEASYQAITFDGMKLPADLPEFQLGEAGRAAFQGHPLEFYTERLQKVRFRTLQELRQREDDWLYEVFRPWGNRDWNNAYCWFHVYEDELRHQGQIAILRKEIRRRPALTEHQGV